MLLNRAAALGQAITAAIVVTTALHPTDVGFIRGPFTVALGGTYIAAATAALAKPSDPRTEAIVAAVAVTWWGMRSASLATEHLWTGAATCALLAAMVFLFYWRSLARAGFLSKLDEIEAGVSG